MDVATRAQRNNLAVRAADLRRQLPELRDRRQAARDEADRLDWLIKTKTGELTSIEGRLREAG